MKLLISFNFTGSGTRLSGDTLYILAFIFYIMSVSEMPSIISAIKTFREDDVLKGFPLRLLGTKKMIDVKGFAFMQCLSSYEYKQLISRILDLSC